jgi:hypothetical protein
MLRDPPITPIDDVCRHHTASPRVDRATVREMPAKNGTLDAADADRAYSKDKHSAIAEYDGGLSRSEADHLAAAEYSSDGHGSVSGSLWPTAPLAFGAGGVSDMRAMPGVKTYRGEGVAATSSSLLRPSAR